MSRRVFLSFHHRDLWRAQIVRNSGAAESVSLAGFSDAQKWKEVFRQGDAAMKAHIERCLEGTSVTIVLIGAETATQSYVSYEIERSVARGNGIFGIRIHSLMDSSGATDAPGTVPDALLQIGAPIYEWRFGQLRKWIDAAEKEAGKNSRGGPRRDG